MSYFLTNKFILNALFLVDAYKHIWCKQHYSAPSTTSLKKQDIINFVSIVVSDCTFKTKVQTKPKLPKTVAMDLGLEKDLKKDIYNYYLKVTQNLVIG